MHERWLVATLVTELRHMPEKDEIARRLAEVHFEIEPGMVRIFQVRDRPEVEALPNAPIKLLEVNADTVPSGVMPLHFRPVPAAGIPYPSVIVEVTPDEFDQITARRLQLPDGWTIGEEYMRRSG